MKQRAPALPDFPTFQQLWDALGSRLIETARGHILHAGGHRFKSCGPSFCDFKKRGVASLSPLLQRRGDNRGEVDKHRFPLLREEGLSPSPSKERRTKGVRLINPSPYQGEGLTVVNVFKGTSPFPLTLSTMLIESGHLPSHCLALFLAADKFVLPNSSRSIASACSLFSILTYLMVVGYYSRLFSCGRFRGLLEGLWMVVQ